MLRRLWNDNAGLVSMRNRSPGMIVGDFNHVFGANGPSAGSLRAQRLARPGVP